jgi:hypothetical protein
MIVPLFVEGRSILPPFPKWTALPLALKPAPVIVTCVPTGPEPRDVIDSAAVCAEPVAANRHGDAMIMIIAIVRWTALGELTTMATIALDITNGIYRAPRVDGMFAPLLNERVVKLLVGQVRELRPAGLPRSRR